MSLDCYALRPLGNTNNASQASFNDQNYGQSNHMSSSSSSLLLPNSDAYLRNGDVAANFISSKMATNSPSSSPSLNFANQATYADQLQVSHHRPSYSPKPSRVGTSVGPSGSYDNHRAMTEPGFLLDSNERAQLGLMSRKSLEDHLMKKQFDAQLSKVSGGLGREEMLSLQSQPQQQSPHRQSIRTNNIILAQIQTSREIAKSCRDMTSNANETFY